MTTRNMEAPAVENHIAFAAASSPAATKDGEEASVPMISNMEVVTTYNWLGCVPTGRGSSATAQVMAVPGAPAKFFGSSDPFKLEPETTIRYIDENAVRCPASPFEPGVRAVLHQQPNFDFTDLDLITDRGPLMKLLELAAGSDNDDFQFGAQVVGLTVVFIRSDGPRAPFKYDQGGHRGSFEKAHLQYADDLAETTKHYRIITYKFGDMKIMLRHGADAYIPHAQSDDLKATGSTPSKFSGVVVKNLGTYVPQDDVFEFMAVTSTKTQTKRVKKNLRESWLSQFHHFAVARPIHQSTPEDETDDSTLEARFHKCGLKLYFHEEIAESVDAGAVQAFYKMLEKLLQDLRSRAAGGSVRTFLISHKKGEEGLRPLQVHNRIPGLSPELQKRLKMSHMAKSA